MGKFMNKNNLIKLIFILISELICLTITRSALPLSDSKYFFAINIIQTLYFLPIFLASLYIFLGSTSEKSLIVNSTVGLIVYSILLHIFIVPLCSVITNTQGIINFVEYASKIYFICLPLEGFFILLIKKEIMKKSYFLILIKIIILIVTTFLLKHLAELNGVLYSVSFSKFIIFIFSVIIYTKKKS